MSIDGYPVCLECGHVAQTRRNDQNTFCSPKCRMAWHNRRRARGAELYDFVMAWRFERNQTDTLAQLGRLASAYNDADKTLRDGRRSWDLKGAQQRMPGGFGRNGDRR